VIGHLGLKKYEVLIRVYFKPKRFQSYFRADGKPGLDEKGFWTGCVVIAVRCGWSDGFDGDNHPDRAIDSEHAPIPSLFHIGELHHHINSQEYTGASWFGNRGWTVLGGAPFWPA